MKEAYRVIVQNTSQGSEEDLKLNTDIVRNRTATYHSLSDLYGIQLFTDARIEENLRLEKEQEKEEKDVRMHIFTDKFEEKDRKEEIAGALFQERMVIVMNQDYEKEARQTQIFFWAGGAVISMIFAILWYRYFKKRKKGNLQENSYE